VNAGMYVHVPFCLTRCGYCDFNAYAGLGHLADRYATALEREADLVGPAWVGLPIDTVFFGGGTPTTLSSQTLARILAHLRARFTVAGGAEITVEANPDTLSEESLRALLGGGFNRLSMGVQSFDPAVLEALERAHGPDSARRSFAAARRSGFTNINLDLIFGAQGESVDSWRRTLEEAIELGPEHLSCYALTVEPATPLGRRVMAGVTPAPDQDAQADMFELACALLAQAGYSHYEVSNWARAGLECRHNLGYWRRRPYAALGAGAHGYRDGRRWWNLRSPAAYLEAVERGSLPVGGEERLGAESARLEEVFLALRTAEGLPVERADRGAGIAEYLQTGLMARRDGRLVLTERGMFLAGEIALALAG
jgi:putative oxygen-independent coproporphyrinogen III oxidase